MSVPYNITISGTSPLFQYLPFPDGPIDTSWNATFSGSPDSSWVPESLGVGASSHRTTLGGASARLDWVGTAIWLYGDASAGGYTISLDGTQTNAGANAPSLLFTQSGLNYGSHSLLLQVLQGATSISSATITVGMGENGATIQNYTIPTTSVPLTANGIVLSGSWINHGNQPYGVNGAVVPRIATNTSGSSISFPLTSASAFYIIGHVNYNHGPYHVTLTPPSDLGAPQITHYNGSSRWIGLYTITYLASGLDRTRTYQVEVTNDDNLYYDMSQIVVFDTPPTASHGPDPGSSSSSSPSSQPRLNGSHTLGAGPIAGLAAGCALLLLILIAFLLCMWGRRKRRASDQDSMIQYNSLAANGAAVTRSNPTESTELPPSVSYAQGVLSYPVNATAQGPFDTPASTTYPLLPSGDDNLSNVPLTSSEVPSSPPSAPSVVGTTSSSQRPFSVASSSHLTAEDARFFNNLYSLNVPAAEIATMMETMRAEREAASRMTSSSGGAVPVLPESAPDATPPQYDFKG